jgi:hypothetical protein
VLPSSGKKKGRKRTESLSVGPLVELLIMYYFDKLQKACIVAEYMLIKRFSKTCFYNCSF